MSKVEQIAIINNFLTHGKLYLNREETVYLILHVDSLGQATGYRNPISEQVYTTIVLTEEEIVSLVSLCSSKKKGKE